MVIEPRKIADGYQKRWSKEALSLWRRHFLVWTVTSLVLSVAASALLPGMMAAPVGYFGYLLFVELARNSDISDSSFSGFRQAWVSGWRGFCGRWRIVLGGALLFSATHAFAQWLVLTFPSTSAGVKESVSASIWMQWLIGPESPLEWFAAGTITAFFYQTVFRQMCFIDYPLEQWSQAQTPARNLLLEKAHLLNPGVALKAETVGYLALLLMYFGMPFMTPVIACFLPAYSYVAFREAFLHGDGNLKVKVKAKAPVLTTGLASPQPNI